MSATSYLSSLLTQTSSKYNNLRRALTSSETDGDTEDDSHISRVLRAYYTEKGRPFPEWLPPDPKAPPPPPVVVAPQYGAPNPYGQQPPAGPGAGGGRWNRGGAGGIGDLWGDSPRGGGGAASAPPESLRAGGSGGGRFSAHHPEQQPARAASQRLGDLYGDAPLGRARSTGATATTGRWGAQPQQQQAAPQQPPAGSATKGKDMLKAKLWGSRVDSPPQLQQPHAPPQNVGGGRDYAPAGRAPNPYEERGQGGGGGYGYRAQEGPYADQSGGYGSGATGGGGGSGSRWGGSGDSGGGGARGYGANPYATGSGSSRQPAGGRMGLPSGPRPR
jgi:hypothetical protein